MQRAMSDLGFLLLRRLAKIPQVLIYPKTQPASSCLYFDKQKPFSPSNAKLSDTSLLDDNSLANFMLFILFSDSPPLLIFLNCFALFILLSCPFILKGSLLLHRGMHLF